MAEFNRPLVAAAEQFITRFFSAEMNEDLVFHSLAHTREVVQNSEKIASNYDLDSEDMTALMLASWFHDIGYFHGQLNHEEQSKKIVTEFLREHGADQGIIDKVNGCILATRMPQSPTTLIERIICDADLFHLGTDGFNERNKLLREELKNVHQQKKGKKEWRNISIAFLSRHRYFTDYARKNLEPVKQANLRQLMDKEAKNGSSTDVHSLVKKTMHESMHEPERAEEPKNDAKNDQPKQKKDDGQRSERGTVAMFRIMSESHVSLSQMADSKANIMISVNTIVISIMVSVLLGKLQFYPEFILPTIILVGVCLAAVIFAILATRPNISRGTFTREDIRNKKVNLLFFGNFYNMQLPDYDWAMREMMNDREYLYGSMIKDIYFLGVVLARKYKFLRVSYNIFMYGLIVAILAFGIAFFFSGEQA